MRFRGFLSLFIGLLVGAQTPQWLSDGSRLVSDASGYRVIDPKGKAGSLLHLPRGGRAADVPPSADRGLQAGLTRFLESRVVGVHGFHNAIAFTRVFRTGDSEPRTAPKLMGLDLAGRGRLERVLKEGSVVAVQAVLDVDNVVKVPLLFPLGDGKILSVGPVGWEVPKGKGQPRRLSTAPPGARSIADTPEAFRAPWTLSRSGVVSYGKSAAPEAAPGR